MSTSAWSTQQLAEFLAAVSSAQTEASAALAAVEGVAEAFDAEVAAIIRGRELVAAVGYPEDYAPMAELESAATLAPDSQVPVPGMGMCPAKAVPLGHPPGAMLVVGRSGPGGLSRVEESLLRGMARATSLTMQKLRLLDGERAARENVERLAREQAALRRIATLVAELAPGDEIFAAVAEQAARLHGAESSLVIEFDSDGSTRVAGTWGPLPPVGARLDVSGEGLTTAVRLSGEPVRLDGYEGRSGQVMKLVREFGIQSSVGAPIFVERRIWGIIAIFAHRRAALPAGSEQTLMSFGELVATAISNAQARVELRRIADEQGALRRVATLVAGGTSPSETFSAVAGEIAQLLGADIAVVLRFEPDGSASVVGASTLPDKEVPVGTRLLVAGVGVAVSVRQNERPARTERFEGPEGSLARCLQQLGARSGVGAPITVGGRLWGAVIAAATHAEGLPADGESRMGDFTELVGTAIANAEHRTELTASRARLVAAGDDARRRIERDLHDGIQQRLVALTLELRNVAELVPPERADLLAQLSAIVHGFKELLEELRELSRGVHPAILSKGGLVPALKSLARRSTVPVELRLSRVERLPQAVEVATYFAVSEALANAAKHSGASLVELNLTIDDDTLRLSVRDDGVGGADPAGGSGLVGLTDRVDALGGRITVSSPPGKGTAILLELPVESPSDASVGPDAGVHIAGRSAAGLTRES
jgi:signal transduction histidine kinase